MLAWFETREDALLTMRLAVLKRAGTADSTASIVVIDRRIMRALRRASADET
jgi:hypothetical protein